MISRSCLISIAARKVSANRSGRFILSHWLKPCSPIDRKRAGLWGNQDRLSWNVSTFWLPLQHVGWNYSLFPHFNSCPVQVWEWKSNCIPYFTDHVTTYPCWDKSQSIIVKLGPWWRTTMLWSVSVKYIGVRTIWNLWNTKQNIVE